MRTKVFFVLSLLTASLNSVDIFIVNLFKDFLILALTLFHGNGEKFSASEIYSAGKLQWHFTCGFNFRHGL